MAVEVVDAVIEMVCFLTTEHCNPVCLYLLLLIHCRLRDCNHAFVSLQTVISFSDRVS